MPKDAAVADSKTFTDFSDAQTAHSEFKNFPATRCQSNSRYTRLRFLFLIEVVQQLNVAMNVEGFSNCCQMPIYRSTSMERFPAIIFEGKSFRQHLHDLSLLSGEIPHNESSRWWFSTQKCVHNRSNTVDFCGGVVELLVFEIFSAGRPYSGSDWMPQKSGAMRRCRHRAA